MSFLNTQLTKNMSSQLLRIRKSNKKHVIFKYAIIKKTCHDNYFYDIINPQK